jgi:hypothetical protein
MSKRLIIEIGYGDYFLVDESLGVEGVMKMVKLTKNTFKGKEYYQEDLDYKMQVYFVDDSQFRDLTPEESEEKEIDSLKNSLKWANESKKEKDEKIKELECLIKQFTIDNKKEEEEKSEGE